MWRYALASSLGTAHAKAALPLQDAARVAVVNDQWLIAVVSDGAGGAAQSHVSAPLACERFVAEMQQRLAEGGTLARLADGFIAGWIEGFQQHLRATYSEHPLSDFACTLLAVVVEPESAVYFQLGDGAMVVGNEGQYECVCWPQQGEYANSTHFLTDADATQKVFVELQAGAVDALAIFTDGIQSLVLDYSARQPHAPFFSSFFDWLRRTKDDPSAALAAYLDSDKVNARTDDDKTLILVTKQR